MYPIVHQRPFLQMLRLWTGRIMRVGVMERPQSSAGDFYREMGEYLQEQRGPVKQKRALSRGNRRGITEWMTTLKYCRIGTVLRYVAFNLVKSTSKSPERVTSFPPLGGLCSLGGLCFMSICPNIASLQSNSTNCNRVRDKRNRDRGSDYRWNLRRILRTLKYMMKTVI